MFTDKTLTPESMSFIHINYILHIEASKLIQCIITEKMIYHMMSHLGVK